jgi:hypothetical protein
MNDKLKVKLEKMEWLQNSILIMSKWVCQGRIIVLAYLPLLFNPTYLLIFSVLINQFSFNL